VELAASLAVLSRDTTGNRVSDSTIDVAQSGDALKI